MVSNHTRILFYFYLYKIITIIEIKLNYIRLKMLIPFLYLLSLSYFGFKLGTCNQT